MSSKKMFFYSNISRNDKSIGITKKVFSQIEVFEQKGYDVCYTSYVKNGIEIIENNKVVFSKTTCIPSRIFRFLRRYYLLYYVNMYLKKNNNFDMAYLRYHYFDSLMCKIFKRLKKHNAVIVVEAHGWPTKGKISLKTAMPYFLDMIYEKKCGKYIDYVAAISSEENIWGCTTLHMDNGINCNDINPQVKKKDNKYDITLISVSNEYAYHGYPKIIRSLYEYKKNGGEKRIRIIFVGEFLKSTEKLVKDLCLQDYIFFVGKKYGDELDEIYNYADIGIGALASRAGVSHGSSIKTKEYFAKGLPFITAWKEYTIPEGYPYVLYFDPFAEIVDMKLIIDFYDKIKDDKAVLTNMRNFAIKNYTWNKQLGNVISIIENNEAKL